MNLKKNIETIIIGLLLLVFMCQCSEKKSSQKSFYSLEKETPTNGYDAFYNSDFPYQFERSNLTKIIYLTPKNKESESRYWINILYPKFNATIYLSYKKIENNNLEKLMNSSRKLLFKHTVVATAIDERTYRNRESRVYGFIYELRGKVASQLQFVLTDSVEHFIRGALYFNDTSNNDSIAPMVDFIERDIVHLTETLKWNTKK